MSNKKTSKISTLGSQAASAVSVALVLLILGVLATLGFAAGRVTSSLLGEVSVIVKISTVATPQETAEIGQEIEKTPYAARIVFTSADDVLAQEMENNADILDLIGQNPYNSEYEVILNPAYVHPDSITMVATRLSLMNHVDEVVSQAETVKSVTTAMAKASIVLSGAALIMLVISLVLIFNTVSIAVYGRRFIIRTMQLVGATPAFIRRPFLLAGMLTGFVAGVIASLLLIGAHLYVASLGVSGFIDIPASETASICAGMIVTGMAICTLAALVATNRYLNASYDTLNS